MCGITGTYSHANVFSIAELHAMTNSIQHRGPDAEGYFTDDLVGLGHRRLSIIDLSENANQPMTSACGRYVMVYNGEVYNYEEIAEELKHKHKIIFRTQSDSEVILEAYVHYGAEFVQKLNGMFAIAIYDKENHELFICRDRLGIKPLYYFWDEENFAFASELGALTKTNFIPLTLDKKAIVHFLHLGFIPAPLSIYKSIKKLESGTWLKLAKNKLCKETYWSSYQKVKKELLHDEDKATKEFSNLMESAINYQIKSDVPLGVFLSGGIDSSLIAAYTASMAKNKINTFSIGFKEDRFNESKYAKQVSNHLKTNHNEFIASYKDAIDLIDTVFEAYDEPFSDSSSIPTLLVSKLAKKQVSVCLSGDGGDELFMGYGSYQWAKRLNNPVIKSLRHPIGHLLSMSKTRFQRHGEYFKYPKKDLQFSHILSQEQNNFSQAEIRNLIAPEFTLDKNAQNSELLENFEFKISQTARALSAMEKQAIFDLNFYLQDDLLTKVDRASMHYSLETRIPFLDHRIVEFGINLSPELKIKNRTTKYLLKKVLFQKVPKELFNRPKQGFSIPLENWLQNDLRYLIEENLSKKVIEQFNIVKHSTVKKLIADFFEGEHYLYNRIWLLIILHKWLIRNSINTN